MYLLNKDTASRRAIVFKNGNESIAVNAEMVKFAAQQIGCSEQEIYKYLEGDESFPVKQIVPFFERAKQLKGTN